MVGKIYVVRHGHGYHQEAKSANAADPRLRDAHLTIQGELQSVILRQKFTDTEMNGIGVIVTSPLRRAIHTALLTFSNIIDKRFYTGADVEGQDGLGLEDGVDLVIDPNLQETDTATWNMGSTMQDLKSQWPNLDYPLLKSPWPSKTGPFDPREVKTRAQYARNDLWARTNVLDGAPLRKDIVVITHGGFIQDLAEGVASAALELGNAERIKLNIKNTPSGPMLYV
jgi:broad specificity phosphatase PhoE